jgi:2-oxoglutarate dehydrogenase complex dehydrogenase (E1) component-like enzyme
VAHAPVVESFAQRAKANAFALKASAADLAVARKQVHVQSLIAAYRFLGSRWADLDPLKRTERPKIPELEPAFLRPDRVRHGHHLLGRQHLLRQGREHDPARDRAGAA